jgi:hypothetical protein
MPASSGICEFLRKSAAILPSSNPVQAVPDLGRSQKQAKGPYLIMMRVNFSGL